MRRGPLPRAPRRILLVKLRALGDAVLTLPSLQVLARGFPGASLSLLCPPAAAELFRGDPRLAELIPYDRRALAAPLAQLAFLRGLRSRRFDLAVCLHASFRTGLLAWLSGAPWRSVRNHSGPDWFCNLKAAEPKEPKSIIQRDFDALRACGLQARAGEERPRLFLPAAAREAAARRLRGWRLEARPLLLFPGAGKPEKRWPLENFVALARGLSALGRSPVFLSGPGEPGLEAAACAAGGRADSVSSLQELGALCALAGAAVGNDSGPRHIAAASGARTLTLFGPESLREWHPYARERGHWALRAASGRVADLEPREVLAQARRWLGGKR